MSTLNRTRTTIEERKSHVADAAGQLIHEGKLLANEIYEDGVQTVADAQDSIKEYADHMTQKVKETPISLLLIAGGIGFLLSSLLRR